MQSQKDNKRIIQNTIYLYFRMVIVMLVTLYTSRVILLSLGVEDFGIYNLVFGVVAVFNVINGALTDASQRFITFELGKAKGANVGAVFSQTLILHFFLAIVIVAIAESAGLWFLYNKLIIPHDRLNAAFWIYQFCLASLFILIISVPYNALIIAHERMKAFAFISIVDVFAKLLAAFLLLIEGDYDKLILYGFLMLVSQIVQRILYTLYCKYEFSNIHFRFFWDKKKIAELLKFATWTILGNLSYVGTTQGISVLLGMFFLPVVNAARGIAVVVQGAVDSFVRSFQTAVNPQITKTFASGYRDDTIKLAYNSSRYSFFLMLFPVVPLFFETKFILNLWLTEVPQYTIAFVRYALLISLIATLRNPMEVAVKATGEIKIYEITVATLKLLTLPIAYILLKNGNPPTIVVITQVATETIASLASALVLSHSFRISYITFIRCVLVKTIATTVIVILIPYAAYHLLSEGLLRLFILTTISVIWSCFVIYLIGITSKERKHIFNTINRLLKQIRD